MRPKHKIELTDEQRAFLKKKVTSGVSPAREIAHARILLKADEGLTDARIAQETGVSEGTVENVRRRYAQEGLDASIARKPQPPRPHKRKLTAEAEAKLLALARSEGPAGRPRWTLRLLAEKAAELGIVEGGLSHESVRQALKKASAARNGAKLAH